MRIPAIKSMMTAFPYAVDAGAPLEEARELMREHGIRHLPVTRAGELVGVVSDRDLSRAEGETKGRRRGEVRVWDVCARQVYVVDLEEPLDNVLLHMARQRIGSTVVAKDGKVAGIFTTTDACRAFAEFLRREQPPDGDAAA
jgi:signal-transduction protein with cAMP-binding, CBS, and nucleotidyltransferase domain